MAYSGREQPRIPALRESLNNIYFRLVNRPVIQSFREIEASKTPFTKVQAYFVKKSSTAAACMNCIWYSYPDQPPLYKPYPHCVLVSEKGSPDPGIITPTGICGLYQATLRRIIQFQILYGRGEGARGLLPQVIRKRVQKWSMSKIDPNDIPEELRAV
jgi:hypothetical protein